jgi:hypothetical protein
MSYRRTVVVTARIGTAARGGSSLFSIQAAICGVPLMQPGRFNAHLRRDLAVTRTVLAHAPEAEVADFLLDRADRKTVEGG